MYVPGRGCRVPSQDSAIWANGRCCAEARELVGLRAPQGTVSRNFNYPCCFRDGCVALGPDPEGVWGKFRGLLGNLTTFY